MTIKLAGITFLIQSQYSETELLCRAYETADPPEIKIRISQGDITLERERSAREDFLHGRQMKDWSDGYLETLAVYRKIAEKIPVYDTFLFHGSAIIRDGKEVPVTDLRCQIYVHLWCDLFPLRAFLLKGFSVWKRIWKK